MNLSLDKLYLIKKKLIYILIIYSKLLVMYILIFLIDFSEQIKNMKAHIYNFIIRNHDIQE